LSYCEGPGAKDHAAAATARPTGDDVLLIAGSDHGQESVLGHVAIGDELVAAGLKDSAESVEVAVAPQGGSGLIYLTGDGVTRTEAIIQFLCAHPPVGEVFAGTAMRAIGQAEGDGLAIAFAMANDGEVNEHGVPGRIWVCTSDSKPGKLVGRGSHGGLGRWERHPFLIASGGGFAPNSHEYGRTRLIDIAPTILRHLGLPSDGMDGLSLPRT
jgi:arylsulfatase A-like enzyme